MATRIALIITIGGLLLSLFENWRYRNSTKDFKSLYEEASVRLGAYQIVHVPLKDMLLAILETPSLKGKLSFVDASLTGDGVIIREREVRVANWDFDFAANAALDPEQLNTLKGIVESLRVTYPGSWSFRAVYDGNLLRMTIMSASGKIDEKMSRFAPLARDADLSRVFDDFQWTTRETQRKATHGATK